ncbi:quinone oxidoreductase (plasmid) [Sphingomonas sp. NY01]|uniref:quinone oxidoreductase family protein n=1 Tax=Sphingomonas sp. NY01 TaxID=2968057 RepID=UPI00315C892B
MDIAVRLKHPGGPNQLETIEWPAQVAGKGELLIRHEAIGLNFIDIYHRTGLYPLAHPAIPGVEGVARIEAIGDDVQGLHVGQRIAYAGIAGGYATTRLLPAWRAVPLPEGIDTKVAAAFLLRGLTIHMLMNRTFPVTSSTTLLVHAAAGGLGAFATLWAKRLGATVIGTVGSDAKASIAISHGVDHVIVGRDADFAAEVSRLTEGRGVDFAIDGIGGSTLGKTLECVRRFGTVASIGEAGGSIPALAVEAIGPLRSLSFARPSVMAYAADPDTYALASRAVVDLMAAGVAAPIGRRYPLREAPQAHADLEAGLFSGAAILLPG